MGDFLEFTELSEQELIVKSGNNKVNPNTRDSNIFFMTRNYDADLQAK
jgi:hypothetical protein